jgi:hypothetical protein
MNELMWKHRQYKLPCKDQGCHADVFGRTDGRTDDRTMAAGASVTWTHCSVLFEVTWGKTAASARTHQRPRGRAASRP